MSELLQTIQRLIGAGDVRISEHGYDELAADEILARDVIEGIRNADVVEEYPAFAKGPAVLVLEYDRESYRFMQFGVSRRDLKRLLFW